MNTLRSTSLALTLLAATALAGAAHAQVQLLTNGGFENGTTGYAITAPFGASTPTEDGTDYTAGTDPDGGTHYFDIEYRGSLSQTLDGTNSTTAAVLMPDSTYTFTGSIGRGLSFSNASDTRATNVDFQLLAGSTVLSEFYVTGGTTDAQPQGTFHPYTFTFDTHNGNGAAALGQTLQVLATFTDQFGHSRGQIDGLSLTVVAPVAAPEPSQFAALGMGILGLAGLSLNARKRIA